MKLVICLSGLFYLFTVVNSKIYDYVFGYKFVKRSDGLCYLERYVVSTTHGTEKKEPLRNYVPQGVQQIECYDGHTVRTMNMLYGYGMDNSGEYRIAICFFLPKENQRFVCRYLEYDKFETFAEKECNNPNLDTNDVFQYFAIAYYYNKNNPKEAGYAAFYSGPNDDDACEYDFGNNTNIGRGGILFWQWDSISGDWIYRNDTYLYTKANDNVIRYDKKMITYNDEDIYLGNEFEYLTPFYHNWKERHVFVGYKYVKEVYGCFIESNNVESKKPFKYPMKCYDNLNGYGMNIEWDMKAQKSQLRTCFVNNETIHGPKLECHIITNSNSSEIDVDYKFDKCHDHLVNNKVVNVIVGGLKDESSTMKAIYIETDSKLCKYDAETESDELLEREKYTFGYDPYRNVKLERDDSNKLHDVEVEAHDKALIVSCGINTFVKTSDNEWIIITYVNSVCTRVDAIGKKEAIKKTNWNYDFIVEQSIVLALGI